MKENFWSEDGDSLNLLHYVWDFQIELTQVCLLAQDNLKSSQKSIKNRYDQYTTERAFKSGDKLNVGVTSNSWQTTTVCPYVVEKTLSVLKYVVKRQTGVTLTSFAMLTC